MDVTIINPESPMPSEYAYTLSMTIKSFKGRRDVDVHLFRAHWENDQENKQDWETLIAPPVDPSMTDSTGSKRIVMESFTADERDQIVSYLKEQYSTRLTAINSTPLNFPVPAGLAGLSQVESGKDIGFIEFIKIPNYPLEIPMRGLYDLSQHPPIVEE